MAQYSKRPATSAISTTTATHITVRGKDLASELMGTLDFTSYFHFLLTGTEPSHAQKVILDACLVAMAEHGMTPSVAAARMTFATAPEALQGAVASGLLGCGSVIVGSSERCGLFLSSLVEATVGVENSDEIIRARLAAIKERRESVPGYGHPIHGGGDPRAQRLFALAEEHGSTGLHVAMLHRVADLLPEVIGKGLPTNVSGAIAAVLLDSGFPLEALKGVPLLARTAGLIAHLYEEVKRPIGFPMAYALSEFVSYDGVESAAATPGSPA